LAFLIEALDFPSTTMNSSRDPTARLRAGLNPLLTASLGVYHGSHTSNSTPLSAVSLSSASQAGFSNTQTPVSALQPYNPQEWAGTSHPGADQRSRQFQEPQRELESNTWFRCHAIMISQLTQIRITAATTALLASPQPTAYHQPDGCCTSG
jgi:hypothetical protein